MISADSAVVLIFNGEIYNFRELRTDLECQRVIFRGGSDTEVLLNLYMAVGESLLSRLNGIFSFAIWDRRRQTLLLARDGLGVKPLYYAVLDDGFVFASEIKALMSLLPETCALDEAALQRYLTFLWCPGEGTPLRSVRKLLPGEAMVVRAGRIERRWNWYRLPAFRREAKPALDQTSAIKSTREHLRTAVRRQMVADVPVGAFLSGGLDSSAIVALAREQNPDIRCFTIEMEGGPEAGATDDLPYVRLVAEHQGVPLDVVRIDAGRMAGDLERMVAQLDEPLADPAPLNVLYISQLAREQGIKVLLSGAGGDDLFTGYRRHRALMAERWWSWLPGPMRQGLAKTTGALDQRSALGRRLTKLFSGAGLDGDARLVNYFRWANRADLERLYSAEFKAALGESRAEAPMLEFLRELPPETSRLERMLALEQRFFLADHNLLYTDKMSMAVGVEVRVPFLDLELVEFAARIPARFKQRGSEGKWVLKKAMEPYLPREVIYRPKTGFGAPLRRWMRHELRELLGDLLSEASMRSRGLFDPAAVQRLIADNDAGRVDASYTLLSLLCIEIWCRTYLDTGGQPRMNGVSYE
ncbi:asparagine synthase (glutamine-hydrolyzing) [Lamprobacter modestohalophilus]|uniref:asparagine synthase (glutamine-hydrolyzing) n=2 Tax=Lamprobacter modestohalophilus TaxID=1064514 RepID=A0A9X0WDJ0_9GAMM|nr:asparagine synthase (glutamine-hydrolyzing) [Lamprobacter modestohalophilus]